MLIAKVQRLISSAIVKVPISDYIVLLRAYMPI